jgi:glycosyltransferase involved in cell wall biosynthesis
MMLLELIKVDHEVEICVADDASTDGTWDWCQEMMDKDDNFKAILNDTGKRLGHTILYDSLINEVATNDIAMIYHADMYLSWCIRCY